MGSALTGMSVAGTTVPPPGQKPGCRAVLSSPAPSVPAALFISSRGDSFLPGRALFLSPSLSCWAASPPGRSPNPLLLLSPTGKPTGGRASSSRSPATKLRGSFLGGPKRCPGATPRAGGEAGHRVRGGRRPGRVYKHSARGPAAVYSHHTPPPRPSSHCQGTRGEPRGRFVP